MIKFKRLTVENFLSFEKETIKFPETGLFLLEGLNGAGKSSIFEAPAWALFGQTFKNIAPDKLINRFTEKDCRVSLALSIDDVDYEILKTRNHSEFGDTVMLFRHDKIRGEYENISGKDQNDTQAEIIKLVGMDFKTFQNAVMLNALGKSFAEMTDSEVKAIFDNVLNFEVYTKLQAINNDELKAVTSDVTKIERDREIEVIKRDNQTRAADQAREDRAAAAMENKRRRAEINESITTAEAAAEKLSAELATLKDPGDAYGDAMAKIRSFDVIARNKESEINKYLSQYIPEIEKFIFAANQNKTRVQREINRVNDDISEICGSAGDLDAVIIKIQSNKDKLVKEVATMNKKAADLDQQIDDIQVVRSAGSNEYAIVADKLKPIVFEINNIENTDECPYCKQAIAGDYRKKYLKILNTEREKLEKERVEIMADNKKLDDQIETLKQARKDLSNKIADASGQIDAVGYIDKLIKNRDILIVELSDQQKIIDKQSPMLAQYKKTVELIRAEREVTIATRAENENRAKAMEGDVARIRQFNAAIEQRVNEISMLSKALKNVGDNLGGYDRRINAAEDEVRTISGIISDFDARLVEKRERQRYLIFLDEAFGNGGIKSFLLQKVTPILNKIANDFTRDIADGKIEIEFQTQSYIKSTKKWKEKFAININNKMGADLYKANSMGEKALIDLCIMQALTYLVSLRAGKQFNIKIFDETFGALDPVNSEKMVNFLRRQARTELIFVVSHSAEFKNSFDDAEIIEVRKENRFTKIYKKF